MRARRGVIRLLDCSGTRTLLAMITSAYARWITNADVSVYYDNVWVHRLGGTHIPDSRTFPYSKSTIKNWHRQLSSELEQARDCWMFLYEPKIGDVIIDIGAGSGVDVLEFSRRVGASGKVIAVEAHPGSFELLQKLCERNALTNVVCRQYAVMDRQGVARISDNPGCDANTMAHGPTDAEEGIQVVSVTVDALVEECGLERVDFLKMNIEGAERLAIQGMSGTVGRTGHVCIACHDFRGAEDDWYRTKGSVKEFLGRHGMQPICREDHEKPWVRDHVHAAGLL